MKHYPIRVTFAILLLSSKIVQVIKVQTILITADFINY